jgi:hypothetical protein
MGGRGGVVAVDIFNQHYLRSGMSKSSNPRCSKRVCAEGSRDIGAAGSMFWSFSLTCNQINQYDSCSCNARAAICSAKRKLEPEKNGPADIFLMDNFQYSEQG